MSDAEDTEAVPTAPSPDESSLTPATNYDLLPPENVSSSESPESEEKPNPLTANQDEITRIPSNSTKDGNGAKGDQQQTDPKNSSKVEMKKLQTCPPPKSKCKPLSGDFRQCKKQFRDMIGKHEIRNDDLEQRETDLRQRLEMLECSMPAVMVWNIWRQAQGVPVSHLRDVVEKQFLEPVSGFPACPTTPSQHWDCRVREVEAERKEAQRRAEEARQILAGREDALKLQKKQIEEARKLQDERKTQIANLEQEVKRLQDALKKAQGDESYSETGECAELQSRKMWLQDVSSTSSIHSTDLECLARLQDLAEAELCMKRQIADLERRECAYMRTLQQADEMWAKMEDDNASNLGDLKEQLDAKIAANQQLADRIVELEDEIEKLRTQLNKTAMALEEYTSKTFADIGLGDISVSTEEKNEQTEHDEETTMNNVETDGEESGEDGELKEAMEEEESVEFRVKEEAVDESVQVKPDVDDAETQSVAADPKVDAETSTDEHDMANTENADDDVESAPLGCPSSCYDSDSDLFDDTTVQAPKQIVETTAMPILDNDTENILKPIIEPAVDHVSAPVKAESKVFHETAPLSKGVESSEVSKSRSIDNAATPKLEIADATAPPKSLSVEDAAVPESKSPDDVAALESRRSRDDPAPESKSPDNPATPEAKSFGGVIASESKGRSNEAIPERKSPDDAAAPESRRADDVAAPESRKPRDDPVPVSKTPDNAATPEVKSIGGIIASESKGRSNAEIPDTKSPDDAALPQLKSTDEVAAPESRRPRDDPAPVSISPDNAATPEAKSLGGIIVSESKGRSNEAIPETKSPDDAVAPESRRADDVAAPESGISDVAAAPKSESADDVTVPKLRSIEDVAAKVEQPANTLTLPIETLLSWHNTATCAYNQMTSCRQCSPAASGKFEKMLEEIRTCLGKDTPDLSKIECTEVILKTEDSTIVPSKKGPCICKPNTCPLVRTPTAAPFQASVQIQTVSDGHSQTSMPIKIPSRETKSPRSSKGSTMSKEEMKLTRIEEDTEPDPEVRRESSTPRAKDEATATVGDIASQTDSLRKAPSETKEDEKACICPTGICPKKTAKPPCGQYAPGKPCTITKKVKGKEYRSTAEAILAPAIKVLPNNGCGSSQSIANAKTEDGISESSVSACCVCGKPVTPVPSQKLTSIPMPTKSLYKGKSVMSSERSDEDFLCCTCKEKISPRARSRNFASVRSSDKSMRTTRTAGQGKTTQGSVKTSCSRDVCCPCDQDETHLVTKSLTTDSLLSKAKIKPETKDVCCLAKISRDKVLKSEARRRKDKDPVKTATPCVSHCSGQVSTSSSAYHASRTRDSSHSNVCCSSIEQVINMTRKKVKGITCVCGAEDGKDNSKECKCSENS